MAKQKIRCAKGVRLTAEQRAKLEGFQVQEQKLEDRITKAEDAYRSAVDRLHEAEDAYMAKQGLEWVAEGWEDVVGRRAATSEED